MDQIERLTGKMLNGEKCMKRNEMTETGCGKTTKTQKQNWNWKCRRRSLFYSWLTFFRSLVCLKIGQTHCIFLLLSVAWSIVALHYYFFLHISFTKHLLRSFLIGILCADVGACVVYALMRMFVSLCVSTCLYALLLWACVSASACVCSVVRCMALKICLFCRFYTYAS